MKKIEQKIKKAPIKIYPFSEAPDRYKSLGLMKGKEEFVIVGDGGYSDEVMDIAERIGDTYQMICFNAQDLTELKSIAITYYE